MPWVAICDRLRAGMGRDQDKTYINVLKSTRQITSDAATWAAANPSHPWADPGFNEFIVDLTDQQAADINNGVNPLNWDTQNNPRWQQQFAGSGAVPSFGSWADPAVESGWQADAPIPDDRFIVRIYTDINTTDQVASEEFDEAPGSVVRFVKLFNSDDTPSGTNAANQRVDIGGKMIDFDFGSSAEPPRPGAGVARLNFATDVSGRGQWDSNHRYKLTGPAGEKSYVWQVFGKTLRISAE